MLNSLSDPKKTWAFSAQQHRFVVHAVECAAAAEADTFVVGEVAAVSVTGFEAAGTVERLTQCAWTDYSDKIAGLIQRSHSSSLMYRLKHLAPLIPSDAGLPPSVPHLTLPNKVKTLNQVEASTYNCVARPHILLSIQIGNRQRK